MTENIYRIFSLNNSLAAVSAVTLENSTLATDGYECRIHELDTDGNYIAVHDVTRPYRRLRAVCESDGYTALGCCNSARIYFLSENFVERGYTELDTSYNYGCRRVREDLSELTDAMITTIGSERFIVGAFRRSAYLFDMNGKRLTKLCTADKNETLTDFISLGNDIFAMSTICQSTRTITVSDNGNIQSANLDRSYTLRMLFHCGNDIFGLFGRNYIYNHIIKIYSNGILTLPKA